MPDRMSRTSAWAPKPIAMPTTPAPANSGPMFTPSADSTIITTIANSTTRTLVRNSGTRVCPRLLATMLPASSSPWPAASVPSSPAAASARSVSRFTTAHASDASVSARTICAVARPAAAPVGVASQSSRPAPQPSASRPRARPASARRTPLTIIACTARTPPPLSPCRLRPARSARNSRIIQSINGAKMISARLNGAASETLAWLISLFSANTSQRMTT